MTKYSRDRQSTWKITQSNYSKDEPTPQKKNGGTGRDDPRNVSQRLRWFKQQTKRWAIQQLKRKIYWKESIAV